MKISTTTINVRADKDSEWKQCLAFQPPSSDGKVKLTYEDSTYRYLGDIIDKDTIQINTTSNVITCKKLDGQLCTITELNYLQGLDENVMNKFARFLSGGTKTYQHTFDTYADLITFDFTTLTNNTTYLIYVAVDETHEDVGTVYLCDNTTNNTTNLPSYAGVTQATQRDLSIDKVDLTSEVKNRLPLSNIDTNVATKTDLDSYMKNEDYEGSAEGIVAIADTLNGMTKTVDELNSTLLLSNILEGSNVTLTKDVDNNTVTISSTGGGSVSFEEWTSGKSHIVGDYVLYKQFMYQCISTNSDTEFDESNWKVLLSQRIQILSLSEFNNITPQDGIYYLVYDNTVNPNTNLTLDSILQGENISLIKDEENNTVTINSTNVGTVVEESDINGNIKVDGVELTVYTLPTLTKEDVGLNNVDNTSDLNKPISTATQTALGNKIDKTDIKTTISSTSTNEEVASAKSVYDIVKDSITTTTIGADGDLNLLPIDGHNYQSILPNANATTVLNTPFSQGVTTSNTGGTVISLGLSQLRQIFINNISEVFIRNGYWSDQETRTNPVWSGSWRNMLMDSNITKTINSASTDSQTPSAKTTYDELNRSGKNLSMVTGYITPYLSNLGASSSTTLEQLINLLPTGTFVISTGGSNTSAFDLSLPVVASGILYITKNGSSRTTVLFQTSASNSLYTCTKTSDTATIGVWKNVYSTTIKDVPKTTITFDLSQYPYVDSSNYYIVRNGVCYYSFACGCASPQTTAITVYTSMPKPVGLCRIPMPAYNTATDSTPSPMRLVIATDGTVSFNGGVIGNTYTVMGSYPIAEE